MNKALHDILVLDLTHVYNGPYCSLMLAYQGAKVIKIEPLQGEVLRNRWAKEIDKHEFMMMNSNKFGITLNLKTPEGQSLFFEMVKKADIVIENFARGVMNRLGLGYETLKEINPRLIYATSTGYGLEGPYADLPAMDLTIQAMGGVMASTGYPNNPPLKAGPAFADFSAGIHLFGGIMTALYQREKTGKGQMVEVSMHDTIYPTLASALGALYNEGEMALERTGNRHSGLALAPYNVYPANDGYVSIICVNERQWENLVKVAEKEEMLMDPRFRTNSDRTANMNELDEIISSWTSKQNKWNLVQILLSVHVPCAPVLSVAEVAEDPHLIARQMIREVDHPISGKVKVPGSPIRLSDSPLEDIHPAPILGQHTDQILKEIVQIDDEKLMELREKEIIR